MGPAVVRGRVLSGHALAEPPAVVIVVMARQTLSVDLDVVFPPEETTTVALSDSGDHQLHRPTGHAPEPSIVAPRPHWGTAIDELASSRSGRVEIVTNDEYCLLDVVDLRARRGLPRRHPRSPEHYLDKLAMKTTLQAQGVPVVPFVSLAPVPGPAAVHELADLLGPTVVFKPRSEANSRGITVATSTDQCARWLGAHAGESGWLAERFLADPGYHANAVVVQGDVHDVQVGRYVTPLLDLDQGRPIGSYTLPEDHRASAAGRALLRRVVRGLGDDGAFVVHLEFFLPDPPGSEDRHTSSPADGALVLEVAARAPGGLVSVMSRPVARMDLQRAHLRLQAGLPHAAPTPQATHAGWLWYPRVADRPTSAFRPPDLVSDHEVTLTPHAGPSGGPLVVGAGLLMRNTDHAALTSDMVRARAATVWE